MIKTHCSVFKQPWHQQPEASENEKLETGIEGKRLYIRTARVHLDVLQYLWCSSFLTALLAA